MTAQVVKLGEVTDLLTGHPFKSNKYIDDATAPRLMRGDNVVQGSVRWENAKRWPESETVGLEKYWLEAGDVILAMDRPWIEAGLKYCAVSEADLPCLLVQRVSRLRGNENLHTKYLRYVIGSSSFTEYVLGVQTGSAVPHISAGQIKDFQFLLPDYDEQQAIAETLGALDDKIELNRRMNETLEAMARAVFRDWFVDFGPTRRQMAGASDPRAILGGLIQNPEEAHRLAALFPNALGDNGLPDGWEERAIEDVSKIVGGSTPSTKNDDFWYGGQHRWATPKDLSKLPGIFLSETERRITDAGLAKIGAGASPAGSVLLSSRAPVGYLAIAEQPVAVNQGFIVMRPTEGFPTEFAYFWCKENMETIKANANGSTFQEISKKNFRPLLVVSGGAELTEAFTSIAKGFFDLVRVREAENRTLAATRDLLLPKLMSGEIRLMDAEALD